jgi:glycosyltransferase involved in cell wall biosynthesis
MKFDCDETGCARQQETNFKPLVSVTVPTYNSERVIAGCLASVRDQSYPNVETIVIDSLSTDRTREIAASYDAAVITYEGRLLGARHQGFLNSCGEYLLLLDSDQILEATAIELAVSIMNKYDMLVLEELSYEPKSWLQKLFSADRRLIHKSIDEKSLDPLDGTLLPRFFRREVLARAFGAIPEELIPVVVHHDHAILYLEARKVAPRVGILPNGVYHREPSSFITAWKRNFRYGRSLRELPPSGRYKQLLERRDKGFRRDGFRPGNMKLGIQSFALLALLKTAQKAGYWLGGRLS